MTAPWLESLTSRFMWLEGSTEPEPGGDDSGDETDDDILENCEDEGVEGGPKAIEEIPPDPGEDPHICLYRDRTLALLRRYLRMAVEVGRLPSLLGREFFRTRVTAYHTQTFEDSVIFVYDVERSLENLTQVDKKLLAMAVLQEYSHDEVADLLQCTRRTIARQYLEILDRISEIFLDREILKRLPEKPPVPVESCQERTIGEIAAN